MVKASDVKLVDMKKTVETLQSVTDNDDVNAMSEEEREFLKTMLDISSEMFAVEADRLTGKISLEEAISKIEALHEKMNTLTEETNE